MATVTPDFVEKPTTDAAEHNIPKPQPGTEDFVSVAPSNGPKIDPSTGIIPAGKAALDEPAEGIIPHQPFEDPKKEEVPEIPEAAKIPSGKRNRLFKVFEPFGYVGMIIRRRRARNVGGK